MCLPLNQLAVANKVKKAFSELEQKYEREPSPEELSAVLDLPMDKVANTMKMPGKHVSMDAPLVQGEDSTLLDVLENGDSPGADSALINELLTERDQPFTGYIKRARAGCDQSVLRHRHPAWIITGRDRREIRPHL